MQKLRLFISVDLPKEALVEIEKIQNQAKAIAPEAKLVEKENLHITLKFLGQVPKEQIEEIASKLNLVNFQDTEISFSNLGTFKSGSKASIIWLKVSGLDDLQKKVDESLSDLFKKEARFMSHLTLARIKSTPSEIKDLKNIPLTKKKFQIKMIKLKKSTLTSQNPIHTTLVLVQSKNGSHNNNSSHSGRFASGPSDGLNSGNP